MLSFTFRQSVEKIGKIFRDFPIKPVDKAIFWVEYVARHGKDALRSPIVDMSWWQKNLLDVYCFLTLVILIVLFAIKFVLKKLIRTVFKFTSAQSNSKLKIN
jgi:glucuronosyltransferase